MSTSDTTDTITPRRSVEDEADDAYTRRCGAEEANRARYVYDDTGQCRGRCTGHDAGEHHPMCPAAGCGGRAMTASAPDLNTLLTFARAYSDLGSAITEQLDDLLSGQRTKWEDINPNAVTAIEQRLGRRHPDIAEACAEYRRWLGASGGNPMFAGLVSR